MHLQVKMGDVMDYRNFIMLLLIEASFDNIVSYIEYAKQSKDAEIVLAGHMINLWVIWLLRHSF